MPRFKFNNGEGTPSVENWMKIQENQKISPSFIGIPEG